MKIKEKVTMSAFSFGLNARCKPRRRERRRKENRLQISLFAARKDLSSMMTERNPRDTNARARKERERERERERKKERKKEKKKIDRINLLRHDYFFFSSFGV